MPTYKLIYFDFKGRGEVARLLFAEAGQRYEDERIKYQSQVWFAMKESMPFGHLPVLMIDGKPLAESTAIFRYLAKKFKLDGASEEEAALADMILTAMHGVIYKPPYWDKSDEIKEKCLNEHFENKVYPTFAKFEKMLVESKNEYMVGKQLTYADLAIMDIMTSVEVFFPGFLKKYPNLNALVERTMNRPKIKEWIDKRPNTMF